MATTIARSGWHGGRRTALHVAAERESDRLVRTLGSDVRAARISKGWTQAQLAAKVGLSQSRISSIEDGLGAGAPVGVWIALGLALDRPLAIAFSRSLVPEQSTAGHLSAQELVLSFGRRNGMGATFELATRPADSRRALDVCIRDDRRRVLRVHEISNRADDLGQTVREHQRKRAEAEQVAVVLGGDEEPYRVAFCWVVRATAANQALLARYPHIIESTFSGSSRQWVRAVVEGADAPTSPGIVWVDLAGTRIYEHRRQPSSPPHRPDR